MSILTEPTKTQSEHISDLYGEIKRLYGLIRQTAPTITVAEMAAAIEADEDAVSERTIAVETKDGGLAMAAWASFVGDPVFMDHNTYDLYGHDDNEEECYLGTFNGDTELFVLA